MNKQELQRRIGMLVTSEQNNPEQWWWLSFCDPKKPEGSQFLGVLVVKARGFGTAISLTHLIGINPGGECQGWEIPAGTEPTDERRTYKLLTKDQADAFKWKEYTGEEISNE